MQGSAVPRAVAAAKSTASSLGLTADEAIVLHDSNKLTLRLMPCDVLARVAPVAHQVAQFELELAQQLLESWGVVTACPASAGCRTSRDLPAANRRCLDLDTCAMLIVCRSSWTATSSSASQPRKPHSRT